MYILQKIVWPALTMCILHHQRASPVSEVLDREPDRKRARAVDDNEVEIVKVKQEVSIKKRKAGLNTKQRYVGQIIYVLHVHGK